VLYVLVALLGGFGAGVVGALRPEQIGVVTPYSAQVGLCCVRENS
jgi:hypothetical protein